MENVNKLTRLLTNSNKTIQLIKHVLQSCTYTVYNVTPFISYFA